VVRRVGAGGLLGPGDEFWRIVGFVGFCIVRHASEVAIVSVFVLHLTGDH